ncbi:hypothetical protein BBO99_00002373 [Phytophthora kernoviae]|uniref:peptide-methionine (S)-S-oxide reductase n=2 Tax=Phytophthora kernoviae TaxID=325452 RepID=A0A3R7H0L0_9STRA|nr:hypothetical protein G195_002867 [Phytophthora kernoviae 00238/432]KAG2530458.1 hypothetical protein JM18_002151 [Phytophthora kernoviae]RLN31299.1 hypothetical protein BBI17_002255 [Phytophthora kernoviae]RLN83146.1 hypothetical protein BBO99_00002373 [Phytophthora kernoviae]
MAVIMQSTIQVLSAFIMTVQTPHVTPIQPPAGSAVDFGAVITNVNIENLTDSDFNLIRNTLYKSHVVVLKSQQGVSARAQYELTQRFDPASSTYGHGKTLDTKRSVLHPDLKTVPHQPQVQIIGHGHYDAYEGLKDFTLKHPHHKVFHKTSIPEEDDLDFTRFYRWHIDAALYKLNLPKVTTLLAVKVPRGRRQTLRYDDGTDDELDVPLGTTAFVSGQNMYEILSDEDKEFVRGAKVEYAPHPYVWMSPAKSRSDGLGLVSEGLELPFDQLPPIDKKDIKILPMCWKNPVTGKLALQIHPSAIIAIHYPDGSKMTDLVEVRELVHRLQRPAIAPKYVYAHNWEEGDLVLFNNQGVLHSVVGAFGPEEKRLFRQCNLASRTSHAEAIKITYDESQVSYDELLKAFWSIHDPTTLNRQKNDKGTQYRSGIYYNNEEQRKAALASKEQHQKTLSKPIVTEIEEAKTFWDAEASHQKYLEKGGQCADKGCEVPIRCYG